MIYVLADAERTTVKIGFSGRPDPIKRCESLEQNHPKPLVLLLLLHGMSHAQSARVVQVWYGAGGLAKI